MSGKRRFHSFLKYLGQYTVHVCGWLFPASVISFAAYFLAESFKTGIVSNYFDLNFLLILAIISGLTTLLLGHENNRKRRD